jgi:hypothetical protein
MRHKWNLRRYPRGRPQRRQRVYWREENFGLRLAFAINDFFAIVFLIFDFRFEIACRLNGASQESEQSKIAIQKSKMSMP